MAVSEELQEQVRDLLAALGPLAIKRMFGGAGVYVDGMMFGLLAGETLYLKVDDINQPEFEAAGSGPFVFEMKDGRSAALRYWRLPDTAADDQEEATRWARLAIDAALRARRPKSGKRKGAHRPDIGPGPWDG